MDASPLAAFAGLETARGTYISVFGLGGSAYLMPLFVLGKSMGILLGLENSTAFGEFLATFSNCFVISILASLFFLTLVELRVSKQSSLITTFLLSFCTTMAVYGRGLFADAFTALILLLAFRAYLKDAPDLCGTAIAILFATRLEYALLAGVFPLFFARKKWIQFLIPVVLTLFLLACLNYVRFGNPFNQGQLGYDEHDKFSTPLFVGLFGLFFSPGKGLLWYSPPILLSLIGFKAFSKETKNVLLFLGICVPIVIVHALWHSWMGGWSYGPRRLIGLLPILLLPAGFGVQFMLRKKYGSIALAVLACVGFIAQVGGLTTNFMTYIKSCPNFSVTLWTWHYSAMIGQVRMLFELGNFDIWYIHLFGFGIVSWFFMINFLTLGLLFFISAFRGVSEPSSS